MPEVAADHDRLVVGTADGRTAASPDHEIFLL
jgi:hypothetical protein